MSDDGVKYLPRGSMTKARRTGFAAGVVVTLLVMIAALLMLAIVLLAVLRGGNGWGSGCCQPACCAQQACPAPQADRHPLQPDVDLRGRPLPHADPRDESIPIYRQPDNRAGYVRPCGCQALPWWQPHTPDGTVHSVPEPGTLALIAAGSLALWRLT